MRYTWGWLALVLLLVVATAVAQAAPVRSSQPISVTINGQPQHFATPPLMVSGQVLVPMRETFQALNTPVSWDSRTRMVTAQGPEVVRLQVGSRQAFVGQRQVMLTTPARVYRGQTYVPLRFVSESLGAHVAWNPSSRMVSITSTAIASRPRQYAEAPPITVAPAQPQVQPQEQPPAQPEAQVVTVVIKEWSMATDPTTVHPGPVLFQIRNEGKQTHAFAIDNTNIRTPDIEPGGTATVTFTAEAGQTYTLYCPIDEHRALGVTTRLPVQ